MTFTGGTEDLASQLFWGLSKISHPLEGTFYLFLLAVFFRWKWPVAWNDLLKSIAARTEKSSRNKSET